LAWRSVGELWVPWVVEAYRAWENGYTGFRFIKNYSNSGAGFGFCFCAKSDYGEQDSDLSDLGDPNRHDALAEWN
jgi:hypothetical protein